MVLVGSAGDTGTSQVSTPQCRCASPELGCRRRSAAVPRAKPLRDESARTVQAASAGFRRENSSEDRRRTPVAGLLEVHKRQDTRSSDTEQGYQLYKVIQKKYNPLLLQGSWEGTSGRWQQLVSMKTAGQQFCTFLVGGFRFGWLQI